MPIAQSSSKAHVSTKHVHKKSETESEQVKPVEQSSSSSNTGVRTPPDQPEFIKQTLIIIEKKARNLDKRRVSFPKFFLNIQMPEMPKMKFMNCSKS